jgi:voltage-gated potassium channel Kch
MKTSGIEAIPPTHQEILIAIIIVSIMTTPILLFVYEQLLKAGITPRGALHKKLSQQAKEEIPSVVICGFGRMGQIIAQMLESQNISYVAIDENVDNVVMARENGYNVIYGDSKKKAILEAAGFRPRKTRAVAIALNDEVVACDIVETVRSLAPRIKIFARAHSLKTSKDLIALGVKSATPEIIESSFTLGENLMESLGVSKSQINSLTEYLREHNYANVKKPIDGK